MLDLITLYNVSPIKTQCHSQSCQASGLAGGRQERLWVNGKKLIF